MSSRNLANALRETLRSVEQTTGLSPDDPTLVELRRILLLKIAAVEGDAAHNADSRSAGRGLNPPGEG